MDYIEQFRNANRMLNESRKELSYQRILSQAAFELYEQGTAVSHSLMIIRAAMVDFLIELKQWEIRTGKKNADTQERLDIINKHLDIIAKIEADNYALKWNAKQMREEIFLLKDKVKDLEHQLHLVTVKKQELPNLRVSA